MVDSTSNAGDAAEDAPRCLVCGRSAAETAEHRVVTAVEDGEAVHRHFCSTDCLEEWRE